MKTRGEVPRDQATTPFSEILTRFCQGSCVLAAALVDRDGETVDYAGYQDPFDTRVMAAEWRIIVQTLQSQPSLASVSELAVRGSGAGFLAISLPEGYAVIALLRRRHLFVSRRAVQQCVRELCAEAGLGGPSRSERWTRVSVEASGKRGRPLSILTTKGWSPLEVMGRFTPDEGAPKERGYRVRTETGLDLTLVRERDGAWFADVPL